MLVFYPNNCISSEVMLEATSFYLMDAYPGGCFSLQLSRGINFSIKQAQAPSSSAHRCRTTSDVGIQTKKSPHLINFVPVGN